MLSSLLLSFPQARSLFHSPALNLSSVGHQLREHTRFVWWISEFKWSPYTAEMCGKENLCQCETCVCLSIEWGIWYINQWQGGKERCVGLVTTVGLIVHFTLFHLRSLKKIIFLSYVFTLWCWPEFKASRKSACSHSMKSCDSRWCSVHTSTVRICRVPVWGNEGRLQKLPESYVLPAPSSWSVTWSVLMLQWVGHEEIQKLLTCTGSISSKDMWMCLRGGHREYMVLLI